MVALLVVLAVVRSAVLVPRARAQARRQQRIPRQVVAAQVPPKRVLVARLVVRELSMLDSRFKE